MPIVSLDRTLLLPKSGVGVVAPWLVIAPPGNAPIWLDLRVLDRFEIRSDDGDDPPPDELDAPHDPRSEVILACGDLEVALYVEDGPEAALSLVRSGARLTRDRVRTNENVSAAADGEPPTQREHAKLIILSSEEPDEPDRSSGKGFELERPLMVIGSANDNDIVIVHPSISAHHARMTRDRETGRYTIHDLHASDRIPVNGEAGTSRELSHGDIVDVGQVRMYFVGPVGDVRTAPDVPDLDYFLIVGGDAVQQRGPYLQVGAIAFRINEVAEYARAGANLPLGGGRLLQAACAMLVVAAGERK